MKVTLSRQDLDELFTRISILQAKRREIEFLENERQAFWKDLCTRYKLDPAKGYKFNPQEGSLELVEGPVTPPVPATPPIQPTQGSAPANFEVGGPPTEVKEN